MKWISVKESLPEKRDKVVVTDGESVCLHYKQSGWNFEGGEGDDLYPLDCQPKSQHFCCNLGEGTITHWMPLPPAPGEPDE